MISEDCHVHGNFRMGEGSTVKNDSIIQSNICVGSFSHIDNCHIGRNVKIGNGCYLENSIVCDDVIISDFCHIINARIQPRVRIGQRSQIRWYVVDDVKDNTRQMVVEGLPYKVFWAGGRYIGVGCQILTPEQWIQFYGEHAEKSIYEPIVRMIMNHYGISENG